MWGNGAGPGAGAGAGFGGFFVWGFPPTPPPPRTPCRAHLAAPTSTNTRCQSTPVVPVAGVRCEGKEGTLSRVFVVDRGSATGPPSTTGPPSMSLCKMSRADGGGGVGVRRARRGCGEDGACCFYLLMRQRARGCLLCVSGLVCYAPHPWVPLSRVAQVSFALCGARFFFGSVCHK